MPGMAKKRVSPHTIRHTTATHLLRSGVDINTIRAWLRSLWLAKAQIDTTGTTGLIGHQLTSCLLCAPRGQGIYDGKIAVGEKALHEIREAVPFNIWE